MSAMPVIGNWGRGGVTCLPSELGRGGGIEADAGPQQADVLAAMGADSAIFSLSGDFAEGNMPIEPPFYFPGPVAERYYWDDSSVVGIVGPVGSGKTTTKMLRKLRRARAMPRSVIDGKRHYKVLFVRESYRQLWSSVIISYLKVFPRALGRWTGGQGAPVTHEITFEDQHGIIVWTAIFMAFGDNVEFSLRGVEVTDLDISEADTNPIDTLTFGVGRIGRYPGLDHFASYTADQKVYRQIDCDFNAPDPDNWVYKVFYDEAGRKSLAERLTAALPAGAKPVTVAFHRQPGFGEPGVENLSKLPRGYYELQIELNRLAGKGDVTARMVYNKPTYKRAGDPVFSREFSRTIHVSPAPLIPLPGRRLLVGLDQGFKGAAVIADFEEPFHWRILAELHFPQERLLGVEFGRRLADLLAGPRFCRSDIEAAWGDMAGEQGASQGSDENATWNRHVSQAAGFRVRPQRTGTNRIQPRLEAVRAPLEYVRGGKPGLLIDPSCTFLISGFEARYVFAVEVDASGDKRKVPDKSFTEANVMDALQYLLLSKHGVNGLSPISFPEGNATSRRGHNGGPLLNPAGGLLTGFDVLNPYGD